MFSCAKILSVANILSSGNSKPAGVELLVILAVIDGILDVLGGALLLVVTSVSLSWLGILIGSGFARLVLLILTAISLLLLFFGASSLLLAYGLWKGRGWAWRLALTSAIVGLALSIVALAVGVGMVGVASNGISIYYLTRSDIKAYFGKAPPTPDGFCVHCGNQLKRGEAYCSKCGSKR